MQSVVTVACAQTTATEDGPHSLKIAEAAIREAVARGATLVALPEAFDYLAPTVAAMHAYAAPEDRHPAVAQLKALAGELSVWLLAGSVTARAADGAVVNRSLLIAPGGAIVSRYDKIHLFDVDLPDGTAFRESDFYRAGEHAVVAPTPFALIGLTICYDVRFPRLHQTLAANGARILTIPAAFSALTGPLHWEQLLRARAIETGAFVVAPAQCGLHYGTRRSHGHSMIVDPWGRILAEAADEPCVILAEIDLVEVDRYRAAIPSLANARAFLAGEVAA